MATSRRLAKYAIFIIAILAVTGTFLSIAWMGATSVAIMHTADLSITDVQFDKDFLTITVKNQCTHTLTINEVTVSEAMASEGMLSNESMVNHTSTSHTVTIHAPVLMGEQVSIRMSFKWTSGCLYQIKLETASTADFSPAALCFVRAP